MISVGTKNEQPYSYVDSGFNNFLNRSIASTPSYTLNQSASAFRKMNNQQINYDHSQQTGTLGDVIQAGNAVRVDQEGLHLYDDDGNEIMRVGVIDG